MEIKKPTPKHFNQHVFVCTKCSYQTENGKCSPEGTAANFRKNLKAMVKKENLPGEIRVNASGCLGHCEHGISAVIYPKQDWLLGLKAGEESIILEKLKNS